MSYKVLARQWRPGKFAEVTGQDYTVKALTNAIKNQRLHHAYLFTGTRGIGKTTLARILAKSLNCLQNQNHHNPEPCGSCAHCVSFDQGNFVDLIEVDAASKTKVEDTRDLLERVHYMPTQGRYKVYLIDEVHMLSNHSFNSLLKTLEEPPEHVKFLLATTDPQKIPATVVSRCLQLNLKPVTEKTIAHYLEQVLIRENINFEPAALLAIARQAAGSIRDALSLTDQSIAFTDGNIKLDQINAMLGIVNHQAVIDLLHHLIAEEASEVLNLLRAISEQTVDLLSVLNQLLELLQHIAIIQQVPDPKLCQDSVYTYETLKELGQKLRPESCQLFYQIGLMGKKDWQIAHNSRSHFEMILLRMLAFEPYKMDARHNTEPTRQPFAPAAPTPPIISPEKVLQAEPELYKETATPHEITEKNWHESIAAISVSAFAASLIKQAEWLKQTQNTIFLQLSEGHHALWQDTYQQEIEQALTKLNGKPVRLQLSVLPANTEAAKVKIADAAQQKTKAPTSAATHSPIQQATTQPTSQPMNEPDQAIDKQLDLFLKTFDAQIITEQKNLH